MTAARVHPTAIVEDGAIIGEGSLIWHFAHVRVGAVIGEQCIIGKGAYLDVGVHVGDRCKLQNDVKVYHGATIEGGVFMGPGAMLLNDKVPRAINPDGNLKSADDWTVSPVVVGYGASIGAASVILPGVSVGRWAMVGSGTVVIRDVPDHGLVYGNPARWYGWVCPCGARLTGEGTCLCSACHAEVKLPPRPDRTWDEKTE